MAKGSGSGSGGAGVVGASAGGRPRVEITGRVPVALAEAFRARMGLASLAKAAEELVRLGAARAGIDVETIVAGGIGDGGSAGDSAAAAGKADAA
jgi:hypothetical protein